LIDDDDLVAGAMARMLRPHEVVKVASGSEALERLKEDQSFDVLFCDLMMPGMTGMDLHKTLAAAEPELARRMVFMTGGAFSDRARDFLDSVKNVRVVKPVRAQELKDLVETFLREHPRKPS
jgi:CheY-like chemotaxis protein